MSRPAPDKYLPVQEEAEEGSDSEQNDNLGRSKSATGERLERASVRACTLPEEHDPQLYTSRKPRP